jgi:hypothetical protein
MKCKVLNCQNEVRESEKDLILGLFGYCKKHSDDFIKRKLIELKSELYNEKEADFLDKKKIKELEDKIRRLEE